MAELKNEFKKFQKDNYLNLDYNAIYKKLKNILKNSENPDKDLKDYVYSIIENIVHQNISFKDRIPTEKELAKREKACPTAIHASMMSIGFFHRMCEEIDPSYKIKEDFGLEQKDISLIVNKELDKTVVYNTVLEFMQRDPYDSLLEEVNSTTNLVTEEVSYADLSNPKDKVRLQDIYMKKEMAKLQMASHGKLWRAFHKIFNKTLIDNYNEFIEKADNLLKKYNFDTNAIQEAVENYSKTNDQFDDKGHLKDFYEQKKMQLENQNKVNGALNKDTINLIRYNKAREEENKTHALENKMKEVTAKYPGMDPVCSSIGMIREKCIDYDNTKDKNIFKEITRQIYWDFYKDIVSRQGVDNLNIKEAMHDANKLTLLVMNRYTPIYEDPYLADILPELSFGTMNAETIERATKRGLDGADINVKEEAQNVIDEYKKLDNVNLDKQMLGIKEELFIINEDVFEEVVEEIEENKDNSKVNVL